MQRRRLLTFLSVLGALEIACFGTSCEEFDSFRCGEPLGESVVSRCGNPHEVCVCTTRKCALPEATSVCPTGLRYSSEWPLHPKGRPGDCVRENETGLGTLEASRNSGDECPVSKVTEDASAEVNGSARETDAEGSGQ